MTLSESQEQFEREPEEMAEKQPGAPESQPTASDENTASEAIKSLSDSVTDESSSVDEGVSKASIQDTPKPASHPEPLTSPDGSTVVPETEGPAWYGHFFPLHP